jgi:cell division protein FtsW
MRHVMFLLTGTGLILLIHCFKPKFLSLGILLLPVSWALLILTKIIGESTNGADRWLDLGIFSFQPSELAKLSLIIFTAFMLSKKEDMSSKTVFKWILYAAVPTCGIIFIDNGSTGILLFVIVILLMFIGQMPWKYLGLRLLLPLIGLFALFALAVMTVPEGFWGKIHFERPVTWKARIERFSEESTNVRDPQFKIDNDNYQVSHAKIAVARGGLTGVIPGNSQERDYLPQAYSDFIYAIIIEEMGLLIGGVGVLFLYIMLFIRAGIIANRCERFFPKYLVMGSALILVTQALANMAVAVNLIPVTGQPLPLISRGGTSTIINCVYIGIILSASRFDNPKGILREEEIAAENESAEVEKLLNEDLNIENDTINEEDQHSVVSEIATASGKSVLNND